MVINANTIRSILSLDGEAFVNEAYQQILQREADESGKASLINAMNNGMAKEKILFDLAISDEAATRNVHLLEIHIKEINIGQLLAYDGARFLEIAFLAVIGHPIDSATRESLLSAMKYEGVNRVDILNDLQKTPEGVANGVKIIGMKKAYLRRKAKRALLKAKRLFKTRSKVNELTNKLTLAQNQIDDMQSQIESLKEMVISDSVSASQNNSLTSNATYKMFEDEMRGSRDEIKARLEVYDGIVKKVKDNNGDDIIALDLGCGRGEWLELLRDKYSVKAIGVDSDESMLKDCEANNLDAICDNLVTYLKNTESESVDIITMFQVAEHLPVGLLCDVINEISRVLRIGGACILETPNPENMIVGACNFYFDPTHETKLPPTLLKVFVEGSGLKDAEIMRIHPYNAIDVSNLTEDTASNRAIKQMAEMFNQYADYSVVAYKG